MLHTRFKINGLLSGILVMTALYSINLHIMGKSNVPLSSERTLASHRRVGRASVLGKRRRATCWAGRSASRDAAVLSLALFSSSRRGVLLYVFFRTNLGTAMQAAGDNAQMIRALGVNVDTMIVLGPGARRTA